MKININNYEYFVVDYLEDKLPENLKQEFESFLEAYPHIANDIRKIANIKLSKPELEYQDKVFIKKSPIENISYPEYLIISQIEKQITDYEGREFAKLFENEYFRNEYDYYLKTKLQKPVIDFPKKQNLKLYPIKRVSYSFMAAAAVLLPVIFVLIALFSKNDLHSKYAYTSFYEHRFIPQLYREQPSLENNVPNFVSYHREPVQIYTSDNSIRNEGNFLPQQEENLAEIIRNYTLSTPTPHIDEVALKQFAYSNSIDLSQDNLISANLMDFRSRLQKKFTRFSKNLFHDTKFFIDIKHNRYKIVYNDREFGISF